MIDTKTVPIVPILNLPNQTLSIPPIFQRVTMALMTDGTDTEIDSIRRRQSVDTELVPAPAANFKGSFAPAGRKNAQTLHGKQGRRIVVYEYFTHGWDQSPIWKSALIEMVATMSLCYLSALIDTTIANLQTSQLPAYVGITNIFLLSLFIYASAPASGGHVNPTITFATMTTGLIEFPRAILYLCAQTIGAGLAGGLIRGSFGVAMTDKYSSGVCCAVGRSSNGRWRYNGGGCFRNTDAISSGQAFLIEAISSFIMLSVEFT